MEKLLSKDHFEITNGENILYLNQKANEAKAKGVKVINGTVGMLYSEEGHIVDFPLVDEVIANSNDEATLKYGSVVGGIGFANSVMDWLFGGVDYSSVKHSVIGTLGATGALSLTIRNYTSRGQAVLMPSIRWSNYDSIAQQAGATVSVYNLFNKENNFDVKSLEEKVNESVEKYGRVFLLINDPCQNPTGYTIKEGEWDEILAILKNASKKAPVVLLDDIAYLNYSRTSYDPIIQKILDSLNDNFMAVFAFSASKTLSIYGLRGGAAIGFTSSQEGIDDFKKAMEETARSIWSSPNSIACRVIEENFNSLEKREILRKKLSDYLSILEERANIFINEAKKVNLVCYPYVSGFFVLIPCPNNQKVVDQLIEDENLYVVPLSGGIRVALSCLTKKEIVGMATKIKKAYDKING
jgi:aspartate aminotransferase/aromatic-amino-acid transaminase